MEHPINTPEYFECPLCACATEPRNSRTLYGYEVCKSCSFAFATRRRIAYLIDLFLFLCILDFLIGIILTTFFLTLYNFHSYFYLLSPGCFLLGFGIVFPLFKDAFGGYSPGKALLGLQVICDLDGEPIGLWKSLKRNYGTSSLRLLRAFFELARGYRIGDEQAQSKVIWIRYADHPVFWPVCRGGLDCIETEEQMKDEKRAEKALKKAVKTETKGKWEEAIAQYNAVIADYPDTQIANDASLALEALMERIDQATKDL